MAKKRMKLLLLGAMKDRANELLKKEMGLLPHDAICQAVDELNSIIDEGTRGLYINNLQKMLANGETSN